MQDMKRQLANEKMESQEAVLGLEQDRLVRAGPPEEKAIPKVDNPTCARRKKVGSRNFLHLQTYPLPDLAYLCTFCLGLPSFSLAQAASSGVYVWPKPRNKFEIAPTCTCSLSFQVLVWRSRAITAFGCSACSVHGDGFPIYTYPFSCEHHHLDQLGAVPVT